MPEQITKASATEVTISVVIPQKTQSQTVPLLAMKQRLTGLQNELQNKQAEIDLLTARIAEAVKLGVVESVPFTQPVQVQPLPPQPALK
jgi:hypothetical protein